MNRPWMPLYIADYRADTAHLSAAEHGAYLLLIMHYWQTGGLPKEDAPLARIACMLPAEWRKARPTIAAFFNDDWTHKRIDEEIAHASEISSKRRAAAEQRHSKSAANADANAQQMETQPQPPSQREERLSSLGRKESGYSPPKHGAFHRQKGLIYIREGTPEWSAHAADYAAVYFEPPKPDRGGGYWFKMKGEAAA